MKYICWFAKGTGAIIGYRSRGMDEELPAATDDLEFAWSETQPAAGAWLDAGRIRARAHQPTPDHRWSDLERRWVPPPIAELRDKAFAQIDEVAGKVRLRYITSVPGQAETYQRKEEQARSWAAVGFESAAPSFIAAEAAALNVAPRQVAEEVIALADYWTQAKGPEIEAKRISGKANIRIAATPAEVSAALNDAIRTLEAS